MDSVTTAQLEKLVRDISGQISDPAHRSVWVLEDGPARILSERCARSMRDIYLAALNQGIWPHRYVRNRDILALEDQLKLANARVAVIGAGGLGGTVILLLARIGIGFLTVVDGDVFDETNLNRQALSDTANIGVAKAEEAAKKVREINPAVEVSVFRQKIKAANADSILAEVHVVVDALDNIPDRMTIGSAAQKLGLPLVHGALAGFDGQVMTIFPEDPGLERIYGEAQTPENDPGRPEAVLGVPALTPSIVATIQAMEVIKILLDRGQLIRNRMLHIDLEGNRFDSFSF
ncbi:MAG: HesA/MoeB/ThiF family protein [Desulfobacterales bacterium]|jgi:molybdopterin/thiamine biosynthesis adenylyltransferase